MCSNHKTNQLLVEIPVSTDILYYYSYYCTQNKINSYYEEP